MCGIAGIVTTTILSGEDETLVERMLSRLVHRGPDAQGVWSDEKAVLGHRRLSIVDLADNSNQPMWDDEGQIGIVFNGEIYNHAELRRTLISEFSFRTDHSDTETLLYAYKKWGSACLERLVGMFAIAIYDRRTQELLLVRDRFGKKPLFYCQKGPRLYFASESGALRASVCPEASVDDQAVYDYLTYLTVAAPRSFFAGIQKLEAGTLLRFNASGLSKHRYWNIANFLNQEIEVGFDEAVATTGELLEASMRHRNVSDVPVAVALSAGLDSSLNLHYSSFMKQSQLSAINVAFQNSTAFDESVVARRYADELDVPFESIRISETDYLKWIEEYFESQSDAPIGDPNSPLLFGISRLAAQQGAKVLLVGEGGDEIGGYPVYPRLARYDRLISKVPELLLKMARGVHPGDRLTRELDLVLTGGTVARRFFMGFAEMEKATFWCGGQVTNSLDHVRSLATEINDGPRDVYLRRVLNIEYKLRLAELLLPRVDYPSMAASVEARSPFMDHKLIEYSAQLPFELKMRFGAKSLLRGVAKDKLPGYLMSQEKVGFGQLLKPFLERDLPVMFQDRVVGVGDAPIKSYVAAGFLKKMLERQKLRADVGFRMWVLFALNEWLVKVT